MTTIARRLMLLACAALAGAALLAPFTVQAGGSHHGRDFVLTILHNNDGESQLIDAGSGLEDFGGVARFATLVNKLRVEALLDCIFERIHRGRRAPRCAQLTLSSGDNFLAGPEFNASLEKGVPFFDSIAIDLIGYDALAIGNHEFDFGPDVLADFIRGNRRPTKYLSANLDFSAEPALQALVDRGRIAPSRVVRRGGQWIGIVGATTEELRSISSPRNVGIGDVLTAVQSEITMLEFLGVNKIVLISHLQDVDGDIALAAQLNGVDIMIAGGGDEVLANPTDLLVPGDVAERPYPIIATGADGAQIPVVTTAGNFKYVGRLTARFDSDGNVIGVDTDKSGPVRVAGGSNPDAVLPNRRVEFFVTNPVREAVEALAQNVIAATEVGLDGRRSNVRSVETNLGNLIADSQLWQAQQLAAAFGVPAPQVALQNGGGIRNDDVRGPGDLTELDTFDIVPFSNFVAIVPDISREQFKEIVENAVSRIAPPAAPGGDGRFAQIAGFSFEYRSSGTPQLNDASGTVMVAGTRVVNLTLDDGTPIVADGLVVPGADLTVATIDFLARGGDDYPFRGAPFTSVGVSYQQALENYLVDGLGGTVTAADYPEGGEGRIVRLD